MIIQVPAAGGMLELHNVPSAQRPCSNTGRNGSFPRRRVIHGMTGEDEQARDLLTAEGDARRAEWYLDTLEAYTGERTEPSRGESETFFLTQEVGRAYAHGLYISTILLCAALVEQELFSELLARGVYDRQDEPPLGAIREEAATVGLLDSEESDAVDELRSDRITFFHYRDYSHADAPFRDVLESQAEPYGPYEDYEQRAQHAITTWLRVAIKPWTEWYDSPGSPSA